MTSWIKFHGEIRRGKHRGIPRALRFVFLELCHEARPLRGVIELPTGMEVVDGVHDILGGDRREVVKALEVYLHGPDADAPSIIIEGDPGAYRLRIPSWEAWNRIDDSAERTREYRKKKRDEAARDADVTRHVTVTHVTGCDGGDRPREEEIRSPLSPPEGGSDTGPARGGDVGQRAPLRLEPSEGRRRGGKRRGVETALPDGWGPKPAHYATGDEHGMDRREVDRQAQKFMAGAKSKGRTYVDWDAAFRTWLLNVEDYSPAARAPPREPLPEPKKTGPTIAEQMDALRRREAE